MNVRTFTAMVQVLETWRAAGNDRSYWYTLSRPCSSVEGDRGVLVQIEWGDGELREETYLLDDVHALEKLAELLTR